MVECEFFSRFFSFRSLCEWCEKGEGRRGVCARNPLTLSLDIHPRPQQLLRPLRDRPAADESAAPVAHTRPRHPARVLPRARIHHPRRPGLVSVLLPRHEQRQRPGRGILFRDLGGHLRHLRRRVGGDLAPGAGDAEAGVRREVCGAGGGLGGGRGSGGVVGGVEVSLWWLVVRVSNHI